MHYFKRNIGDYHKKAGRLSMLQHGAYTLLLDACYDREKFPTLEQAIDWCWASSEEELKAVEFVLKKFFTLENGVYIQTRIEEDLAKYHENSKINSRIAIDREAKKRTKRAKNNTKREPTVHEPSTVEHEPAPNHKPLTTNQEPVTKKKTSRFTPPTVQEVDQYCKERRNGIDPEKFVNYYETNGWMRGKTKIKNWKACIKTWEGNQATPTPPANTPSLDLINIARNQ